MMSPFFNNAIGPPTKASGPTWPIQKPLVPPENLPSVIRATVSPFPCHKLLLLLKAFLSCLGLPLDLHI